MYSLQSRWRKLRKKFNQYKSGAKKNVAIKVPVALGTHQ